MFNFIAWQDPASAIMEGIRDLHALIFTLLSRFITLVVVMLIQIVEDFYLVFQFPQDENDLAERADCLSILNVINENDALELFWIAIPTIVLLMIGTQSFLLLYSYDDLTAPYSTFKAIGHQWYWSFEYVLLNLFFLKRQIDYVNSIIQGNAAAIRPFKFKIQSADSYLLGENDLKLGYPRLLSVTRSIVIPANKTIRFITTSEDVIHSFWLPAAALKMDAIPGRLNQTALNLKREGVFYGQCAELCGVNHNSMPIQVVAVELENAESFVKIQKLKQNNA